MTCQEMKYYGLSTPISLNLLDELTGSVLSQGRDCHIIFINSGIIQATLCFLYWVKENPKGFGCFVFLHLLHGHLYLSLSYNSHDTTTIAKQNNFDETRGKIRC